MYYQYIDMVSGEQKNNPFVGLVSNETKLKLRYRDKWYDLIVNKVEEDSSKKTYQYTAVD
jgi:hypothetical protein